MNEFRDLNIWLIQTLGKKWAFVISTLLPFLIIFAIGLAGVGVAYLLPDAWFEDTFTRWMLGFIVPLGVLAILGMITVVVNKSWREYQEAFPEQKKPEEGEDTAPILRMHTAFDRLHEAQRINRETIENFSKQVRAINEDMRKSLGKDKSE